MTSALHPSVIWFLMYVILPIVGILQIILILPIVRDLKIIRDLDDISINAETKISFSKDVFFILWNTYASVAIFVYVYIGLNWEGWLKDLITIFGEDVLSAYQISYNIRFHWAFISLLLLCTIIGCVIQIFKQKSFIEKEKYLYWWDYRISKSIFTVRFIALFFNGFGVLYVMWTAVTLAGFITYIAVSSSEIDPILFHADNTGGLSVVGDLCITLAVLVIFNAGVGLAAIFDHFGQGWQHKIIDVTALLFLIPAIFILLYPSMKIESRLDQKYENMYSVSRIMISDLEENYYSIFQNEKDVTKQKIALKKWIDENYACLTTVNQIISVKTTPLSLSRIFSLITSFLLPLFIWIGAQIYTSYSKRKYMPSIE